MCLRSANMFYYSFLFDFLLVNIMSSGHKPENPLLLLEQYSDDELVEEESKETTQISEEILSTDPEIQVVLLYYALFCSSYLVESLSFYL